jgi:hypothetical protein
MGQIANSNRLITELQRSITISPLFIYLCLKKIVFFILAIVTLGSKRFCHCRLIFLEKMYDFHLLPTSCPFPYKKIGKSTIEYVGPHGTNMWSHIFMNLQKRCARD